jgi:type IV secretion system protein TrbL
MKKRTIKSIVFLAFIIASTQAIGAPIDAGSLSQILISKMAGASATLSSKAMIALGAFAAVQFVITNYGLLKSGADIEAIYGKLIGSLVWIGFCTYVLSNGPAFISGVGNEFFSLPGVTLPTVGTIIANTGVTAGVLGALAVPVGLISNTIGMLLVYIILGVIAVGCFFAFKIFMLQLELGLIVMLAPLSFAFLGLNALKDQGIAPFKSLISLVYRVILIGVILSAFNIVDNAIKDAFSSLSVISLASGAGVVTETLVAAFGSYLLLAYLLFKSDSIAATLASGSTSMGTGDVASAAAAGAAAGAAVATGGASAAGAAGAATKIPQSMANFMGSLSGGGGSLSNASSRGAGGAVAAMPASPMSSSLSGSPAAAPKFETNSRGAPIKPAATPPGEGAASAPLSTSNTPSGADTPKVETSKADAPMQPAAEMSAGSGASAGVGGSKLDETANRLDDFMKQQAATKKPTMREAASNLNHHIEKEKAATHVSINANASD